MCTGNYVGTSVALRDFILLNLPLGMDFADKVSAKPGHFGQAGAWQAVRRLQAGGPVRDGQQAVEVIGPVAYIVPPNKLHHLFLPEWTNQWPYALLYAPRALHVPHGEPYSHGSRNGFRLRMSSAR
jgi:hypothetical protein